MSSSTTSAKMARLFYMCCQVGFTFFEYK